MAIVIQHIPVSCSMHLVLGSLYSKQTKKGSVLWSITFADNMLKRCVQGFLRPEATGFGVQN